MYIRGIGGAMRNLILSLYVCQSRCHLDLFYPLCLEELEIVVNRSLHVHQLVAVLEGGY